MVVLHGTYTVPLLGVSILIAVMTYITYKLLSSYLHKWYEMKPIPGLDGTYPFIGDTLQFKSNAGGKKTITVLLLQDASQADLCADCGGTDRQTQKKFKLTDINDDVVAFNDPLL